MNDSIFARFKELILNTCGFNLELGREKALFDGLNRRMALSGIGSPEIYHALLIRDNDELSHLVELLTVNETYFFRESDHLKMIADKILPELMTRCGDRRIKILSAGCSTGEEPYSIAMMLHERYGAKCEQLFAISGVDIDATAVASARNGTYGKLSFRSMDQGRLVRYFDPVAQGEFRVKESIRKLVCLEVANLLGSFYPEMMHLPDIIFYRNVSIYFPQQIQREIFNRLAGLLNDGGFLFVSATETIHHDIGILSLIERDSIYLFTKSPKPIIEKQRAASRHYDGKSKTNSNQPLTLHKKTVRTPSASFAPVCATEPTSRNVKHTSAHHNMRSHAHAEPPITQIDSKELFDTALELTKKGEYEKAIAILDNIIELDKSLSEAFSLKGFILLNTARFKEANHVCDTIISRDPLCLDAYLMLGMIAKHDGNHEKAMKHFREAIYLNTACWLAHFHTAEILFAQKESKRARSSYEAAARILENGSINDHGQSFLPLSFNAEHFTVICRHKLSILKEKR
jgi:chemotaxis protein methyltransferase CheR